MNGSARVHKTKGGERQGLGQPSPATASPSLARSTPHKPGRRRLPRPPPCSTQCTASPPPLPAGASPPPRPLLSYPPAACPGGRGEDGDAHHARGMLLRVRGLAACSESGGRVRTPIRINLSGPGFDGGDPSESDHGGSEIPGIEEWLQLRRCRQRREFGCTATVIWCDQRSAGRPDNAPYLLPCFVQMDMC